MKGKIISWKEDKGFGFISTDEHNEKIFFHISSVKKAIRKPEIGDHVVFEASKDTQGRLKATHVLLEDVLLAPNTFPKHILTEPKEKDRFDYFLYTCLIVSFTFSVLAFLKPVEFRLAIIPISIFFVAFILLAARQKRPKDKSFSCSRCRSIAQHDKRTIQAWNNGLNKFYCKTCHQQWLAEKPKDSAPRRIYDSSTKSGCLGILAVIITIPIFCMMKIVEYFI